MVLVCGLSTLYAHYGNSALLIALFSGLKPVVLAIIIFATFRGGGAEISCQHMALFGRIGRFSAIVFCWASNALDGLLWV